jgi:hypothetical protein
VACVGGFHDWRRWRFVVVSVSLMVVRTGLVNWCVIACVASVRAVVVVMAYGEVVSGAACLWRSSGSECCL